MACAPKSNASAKAIWTAAKEVREGRTLPVPVHLRDAHYRGAEKLGHGEGYKYSHDYEDGFVEQEYLPEARRYYEPVDRGHEAEIKQRLDAMRNSNHHASRDESSRGA